MKKNKSKYRSLEDLLILIDPEELKDFYKNNTRRATEEKFSLATFEFAILANEFNIFNFKREAKRFSNINELSNLSRKQVAELFLHNSSKEIIKKYNLSKGQIKLIKEKFNLIDKKPIDLLEIIIDANELRDYYNQNTFTDTCKNFNIHNQQLHELLLRFGIPERPKESDYERRRITFLSNFGKLENPEGYEDKLSRYKETMLTQYGASNPAQVPELKEKAIKTLQEYKHNNHMHQSSKYEIKLKDRLEELFSKDNIIYQHVDFDLYPFNCDFYIKPLNLWLELNGWWHHGKEPFTNSLDQVKELQILKTKYPNQADSLEKVWTKSDPEKFKYAKNNNLNYLAIYDNGSAYNFDKKLVIKFPSLYKHNEIINYLKQQLEEINE